MHGISLCVLAQMIWQSMKTFSTWTQLERVENLCGTYSKSVWNSFGIHMELVWSPRVESFGSPSLWNLFEAHVELIRRPCRTYLESEYVNNKFEAFACKKKNNKHNNNYLHINIYFMHTTWKTLQINGWFHEPNTFSEEAAYKEEMKFVWFCVQ